MTSRHRTRLAALTRPELVVLLLVLAVFAGVGLSIGCGGGGDALRRLSGERTCLSNLRMLGMATFLYADDHDGFFPNTYYPYAEPAEGPSNIGNVLTVYAGYNVNPALWRCPIHPDPPVVGAETFAGTSWEGREAPVSYGFNWYLAAGALETPATTPRRYAWMRQGTVKKPQNKLLIMDRSMYSVTGSERNGIEHVKVHDKAYWPETRHGVEPPYSSANHHSGEVPGDYYEGSFYTVKCDGGYETVRGDTQNLFDGQWKQYWYADPGADYDYTDPTAKAPRIVTK